MNAEEMTDVVYNALKLSKDEWDLDFADNNAQMIYATNIETEEVFSIEIKKV